MQFVISLIVVFTDSKSMLDPDSIHKIVRHFHDRKIACVSGEKRVLKSKNTNVEVAGESLYWRLESGLTKMESELSSVAGAVGELFAVIYTSPQDNRATS